MIRDFLNSSNKRDLLAKTNIIYLFMLKIISIGTIFILVPISIKYLGETDYGVWITVSGIIAWAGMFDFGFSHGLRNRLTEAIAKDDYETGRYLVSSTYFFMFLVALILTILFSPIISIINWQQLLNLPATFNLGLLYEVIKIIFFFFIIQLAIKPINAILQAYQWPAIAQSIGTLSGVFIVISVFLLSHFEISPELLNYAIFVAGIPIVTSLIATVYFFGRKFKSIRPSFRFIKRQHLKSIGGLGTAFFMIQLSLLVVYSSDNLIISYLFGPQEVTTYNVVYRYFSLITILFGVVMAPFWSAITDAYTKGEMDWIRKTIRALLLVLLGGAVISLFLFFMAPEALSWWIGDSFTAPKLLVGLMAAYAIFMGWLNVFSFFSNGIGKIRVQLIAYLFAALINIPLSYLFGKIFGMGSSGVVLATIICMLLINVLLTIQYYKIVNNTADGIWLK